jgi:hypothetical protein
MHLPPMHTRIYILILILVGLLGTGTVLAAAWHRERVSSAVTDAMLDRIDHAVPGFTARQHVEIRSGLQILEEHLWRETLASVVARDIGIAMDVAVLLTVLMEFYARNRLQDEVRTGVLEAAYRRIIPPAIFDEVRSNVLRASLLKELWTLDMTVSRFSEASGERPARYLSKTLQTYKLRNQTNTRVLHKLELQLDDDVLVHEPDGVLPRFDEIRIGAKIYNKHNMDQYLSRKGTFFSDTVEIGEQPVHVAILATELIQVPDTWVWNTRMCTEGVRIAIQTANQRDLDFEVTALHPESQRLTSDMLGVWEFRGGMLPWQGFQIRSRKISETPAC